MSSHWNMKSYIAKIDKRPLDQLRYSMGSYIDLWQFCQCGQWWALTATLLRQYINAHRPLFTMIYGQDALSALVGGHADELDKVAPENDDFVYLQSPYIRKHQKAPNTNTQYTQKVGKIERVKVQSTWTLIMGKLHPGYFKRYPECRLNLQILYVLIEIYSDLVERVAAVQASSTPRSPTDDTQNDYISARIKVDAERLAGDMGY